ncbi:hypothetical protein E2C01_099654 [Portunus trituberculatus]|uniref:Uncharacterized protein n=1 Tax=Portunus trituberculatus TaxID=210409 RepID=A0A5B7KFX0_PORTR|nr:hypothetical protein [Portunus trituberculatus]
MKSQSRVCGVGGGGAGGCRCHLGEGCRERLHLLEEWVAVLLGAGARATSGAFPSLRSCRSANLFPVVTTVE